MDTRRPRAERTAPPARPRSLTRGRPLLHLFALVVAIVVLAGGLPDLARAASARDAAEPAGRLPRGRPEDHGVSSSAVLSFVQAADERIDAMHSFMLVRHGHVVAEGWWAPYDAGTRHSLYSLTKSFTSTAVGLAVAEGHMTVDDLVLPRFPEDAPEAPGEHLKAMRVRDLLAMSTGHHKEAPLGPDVPWSRAFLAEPVAHKPGTFFLYNTPASYMLSAMVERAVGATVLDYLRSRLFEPLGIRDPVWLASPQGVTIGGWGLSLRTEEIARFGQLYLGKGEWQGRRLLPAAWVEAATARQVSNGSKPESDWEQGYGFQFWRCRHGAYRADGAFGQYCIVMPEQDAVVAITSGVKDMQAVLNVVWDRLLPAIQPERLPADPEGQERLRNALARLALRPPAGSAAPPATPVWGRRYSFPANEQKLEALALEMGGDGDAASLVIRVDGAERRLACGRGTWRKGRFAYGFLSEQPAAAAGAWTADGVFTAKVLFPETPYSLTLGLRFTGDELALDAEYNVAFGPTKLPTLGGRAGPGG